MAVAVAERLTLPRDDCARFGGVCLERAEAAMRAGKNEKETDGLEQTAAKAVMGKKGKV